MLMKTLILGVAGAVAVVGGGVAVANHYDQYQNKQHQQEASAVTVARSAQRYEDSKVLNIVTEAWQVQCQKGLAAYAKLSPVVQKTQPAPVCSAPVQSK